MPTRANVLIVDDDPDSQFLAKRALRGAGDEVKFIEAWNGAQAFDMLSVNDKLGADRITHVLLDLNMPVMNGFDFMEAFETLPESCTAGVRIVLVTSAPSPQYHARARSLQGVSEIFSKTLTKSDRSAVLGPRSAT